MNLWQINEENFRPKKMGSQESVYTIGNGYFATRGTFEENYLGATPGTLLSGVFDGFSRRGYWLILKTSEAILSRASMRHAVAQFGSRHGICMLKGHRGWLHNPSTLARWLDAPGLHLPA